MRKILHLFTVTFDEFNASLNKCILSFEKAVIFILCNNMHPV